MAELRAAAGRALRALGLRARPLDWRHPPAPVPLPALGEPGPVDVIVPVHGGGEVVARCLASVVRHSDLRRHRLVVVVDADPTFAWRPPDGIDVVVLANERRLGYPGSVNRGMRHSPERDVVLLNSDTAVAAGWLEGLERAARSAPEVASATPFSNHATLVSIPRPWISNDLPRGFDVDLFAALVGELGERAYPRLPTAVGMAVYLRRDALDRVGLFDEARFGLGYGEENDWSLRALAQGFVHVLADDVFVFHAGQQSFGGERERRVRRAERLLRRLHPAYFPTLAAFMAADPLRPARERILGALERRRARPAPAAWPRSVLHLVHGWPPHNHAGTELYAAWLARRQAERREVAVYARVADRARASGEAVERFEDGVRVRLLVNRFDQRDPLARNALRWAVAERDFSRLLADVEPDLVHVHHLAGHGLSLADVAAGGGRPVVLQVQDWWPLCARSNLWHAEGRLCPGPTPGRCARCLPLTGRPPAGLWSRLLYTERRRRARAAFRRAGAWVMGSRFIESSYREAGWLRDGDSVHVLPYGVARPRSLAPREAARRPLRFGFVGSLMPHKGLHVAVEAFAAVDPAGAVLDVWGEPSIAPTYVDALRARAPAVRWHGAFAEEDKASIFAAIDVLLVPSLGLESFGLVAREAFAHGVPVVAARRSALGELFPDPQKPAGGAFVPPGDAAALRELVAGLVADPSRVDRWRGEIPAVAGLEEHAAAIERVYAELAPR